MTPPVTAPEHVDRHISEKELAERLNVTVRSVQAWRRRKQGPAYVKVGRLVRYSESAVAEYLAARVVAPDGSAA